MNLLLTALSALPLFSTVVNSPGSGRVIDLFQTDTGYIAVASESPAWGGQGTLYLYTLDLSGALSETFQAEFQGEPVSAVEINGGVAVLCLDRLQEVSRLAAMGTSSDFLTEFQGEFLDGGVLCLSGDTILIAGNDYPGGSQVRIARVSSTGDVFEDYQMPDLGRVVDAVAWEGVLFVLGVRDLTGWVRETLILSPDKGIQYCSQFESERITPVSFALAETGLCILSNACFSENNMKSELFLNKLDLNMNSEWTANLAGISNEQGTHIIHSSSGYTVTGWSNSLPFSEANRSDLMMAHFTNAGELEWYRTHGSSAPDYGLAAGYCSDGGYVVGGCTTEELYNCLVLKTDSEGSVEPQGIEEAEYSVIQVRPEANPSHSGEISIEIICLPGIEMSITVFDLYGRTVETGMLVSASRQNSGIVAAAGLPGGMYTITVQYQGCIATCRAIVTGGAE